MKKIIGALAMLTFLCTVSCEKEELGCEPDQDTFSVTVHDSMNEPVLLDKFFSLRLSTGDTLYTEKSSLNKTSSEGIYTIMTEMELDSIEAIRFVGYLDSHQVINEFYQFSFSGCNLEHVSGKREVKIAPY